VIDDSDIDLPSDADVRKALDEKKLSELEPHDQAANQPDAGEPE
jgi:hypothetical protein